jgi:hypothetical protein
VKKRFYLFLPIYLSFFVGLAAYEIIHPPFSTDSTSIGNYEIKLETTPAVPEVGKNTMIHFLVLDERGKPIDSFRIGLQIYYNDNLLKSFPPTNHDSGRYDLEYVFNESGNHIIRADIFDLKKDIALSHMFNVGVLNFYTNVFTYLVIAGIAGAAGIVIAVMIFQKNSPKRGRK